NNKMALATPGSGNLYDAIRAIYGKTVAESLLTLAFENPTEGVKISGFITKPSMLKSTRGWQTFLVNGRLIENRAIAKAIDNAYKSMVPKSGYPMVVLNLTVPPRTVDVNVHPQKSEMKFEDESMIFKAVYKATLDAVRPAAGLGLGRVAASVESPSVHAAQPTQEAMHFVPASAPSYTPHPATYQPRTMYEAVHRPASMEGFQKAQETIQASRTTKYSLPEPTEEHVAEQQIAEQNAQLTEGAILPIGQVDLTYIIAQDAKNLYIVDQHAAHERILFDKFSAQAEGIPSQPLLVHQMMTFDAGDAALIEANQELFHHLGFHLEAAGPQDCRLTEVPADVPTSEAEDIIREILTNLHDMHAASAAELRKSALATTACRAAIKAGEELSLAQMQIILDELSRTPQPFTCPHGRPTILKFSTDDMAKMFKRTGFDLKK
ncbi:DNA mismatch repair endonuclease MutL, partial [Selenomonas sp.]|uniref:DNA mismatch repair endonuclease MutL n=1 Tax=Selenomonas sp. TaxID=2053611 RepID=UPI002A819AF8